MTTPSRPQYVIQHVFADGSESNPQIVPVRSVPWTARVDRRGFLGAGLAAGAALALLGPRTAHGEEDAAEAAAADPLQEVRTLVGRTVLAHRDAITSLVIVADGTLLASGSRDHVVKVWALPDGWLNSTLAGHDGPVKELAANPEATLLISTSGDHSIRLWALPDGTPGPVLRGHTKASTGIAVTPDGKTLVVATNVPGDTLNLFNLPDGEHRQMLHGDNFSVGAIAVSPDGAVLASAGSDGTIRLWKLPNGEFIDVLRGHAAAVSALAFTPDGARLVSAASDRTIRLWTLADRQAEQVLAGHEATPAMLKVSPDGSLLASACRSGETAIRLWSLPDGKPVEVLRGHDGLITALAITPDGTMLCSGSDDKTIRLWELPAGKEMSSLSGHRGYVTELAVTPDSHLLLSGSDEGEIILWDLDLITFRAFLFDPDANRPGEDAVVFAATDPQTGQSVTYTVPAGHTVAEDVTCTCNCVPGTYEPVQRSSGGMTIGEMTTAQQPTKTTSLVSSSGWKESEFKTQTTRWQTARSTALSRASKERELARSLSRSQQSVQRAADAARKQQLADARNRLEQRRWAAQQAGVRKLAADARARAAASKAANVAAAARVASAKSSTSRSTGTASRSSSRSSCTCNEVCACVPVRSGASRSGGGGGGGGGTICTCVPVMICQAHRLLHPDPAVRAMAEQLILQAGTYALAYLNWAAREAPASLGARIAEIAAAIRVGLTTDPDLWPTVDQCLGHLGDADPVIATMAAQMLHNHRCYRQVALGDDACRCVDQRLTAAQPWTITAAASRAVSLTAEDTEESRVHRPRQVPKPFKPLIPPSP